MPVAPLCARTMVTESRLKKQEGGWLFHFDVHRDLGDLDSVILDVGVNTKIATQIEVSRWTWLH